MCACVCVCLWREHQQKICSAPIRRTLEVYILVGSKHDESKLTPMLMVPIEVIVSPPPPGWKWGTKAEIFEGKEIPSAVPTIIEGRRDRYIYDDLCSASIWLHASRYVPA